jgi:hypothetical protein
MAANKKTLEDFEVNGNKVLVRVDFNVPIDKNGHITDDTRIKAALPTINNLMNRGAKVILISHLGRPKGKFEKKYSLSPVAERLSEYIGKPVTLAEDCINDSAKVAIGNMDLGDVIMLENVRFYAEEEKNTPDFAKRLADLADIFINDAFGTAHRAHASTAGVARFLPSGAGLLMKKEIETLGKALDMVRPGIVLYGLYPSQQINTDRVNLKPVMSVKTKISNIKTLPRGKSTGSFVTNRKSIFVTIPVGYADGYSRRLSHKAEVLIKGQRAPVVGTICIDECMIDVTDIQSEVQVGDDVVLFGSMSGQAITVDEIALKMGTINYEVICGISMRVPRVYIKDGKIIKIQKSFGI